MRRGQFLRDPVHLGFRVVEVGAEAEIVLAAAIVAVGNIDLVVGEVLEDPKLTSVRLVTNAEQMVLRETQRAFVSKIAFDKVYEIQAGHSPFLSQPKATAKALLDARRLVHFSGPGFDEIIMPGEREARLEAERRRTGIQIGPVELDRKSVV
mgnify:CR=1 FL=1